MTSTSIPDTAATGRASRRRNRRSVRRPRAGRLFADRPQLGAGRRRGRPAGPGAGHRVRPRHRDRLQLPGDGPALAGLRHRLAFGGFRAVGGGGCRQSHGVVRGHGRQPAETGLPGRCRCGAGRRRRETADGRTDRRGDALRRELPYAPAAALYGGRRAERHALHQLLPRLFRTGPSGVRARGVYGLPRCGGAGPRQRGRARRGASGAEFPGPGGDRRAAARPRGRGTGSLQQLPHPRTGCLFHLAGPLQRRFHDLRKRFPRQDQAPDRRRAIPV